MIATISGRVSELSKDNATIEVGGIGLQIYIPWPQLDVMHIGEIVSLYTFLAVREDSLTLYGFADAEGKQYFSLLIGVNGVGPKLALTILSTLNPEVIRHAVINEQLETFLSDRIEAGDGLKSLTVMDDTDSEVLEALVALGYSVVEAGTALQSIPKGTPEDVEIRLRAALQNFTT